MHIYVTVLNTDIGFICHLRRAVYRSTGLHGPKEEDDDDDVCWWVLCLRLKGNLVFKVERAADSN